MNVRRLALGLSLAVAAFAVGAPALVRAEDAPAAAPTSAKRWTLDFSHGPLRRVLVDNGSGKDSTYLYMTMKVGNKTGLARPWRGLVTAKVDTKAEPYVAGGFPIALDAIRRQEHNKGLIAIEDTTFRSGDEGKIPDGTTYDLVAIFGPVDAGWATFRVDVFGLVNPIALLKVLKYGDKQVVQEAAYQERNEKVMAELAAAAKASGSDIPRPTAEYQDVLERRSYMMEYRRKGDEFRPDDDPIEFVRERWEVIGEPKVLPTR